MKNQFTAKQGVLIFLSLAGLSLFSCSDKCSTCAVEPEKVEKKLSKIEVDADNYSEFKYTNGVLTELIEVADEGLTRSRITYDNSKKPIEVETQEGKIKFVYSGDRLEKEEISYTDAETFHYNKYEYQGAQVKEVTGYGLVEEDKPYYRRKLFYNQQGEVEREEIYDLTENNTLDLSVKINYEYDNKINPYMTTVGSYLSLFTHTYSKHNIVKEVTTNAQGTLNQTITTTYTYDNAGYPLTAVEKKVENGGNPIVINRKFVYQP